MLRSFCLSRRSRSTVILYQLHEFDKSKVGTVWMYAYKTFDHHILKGKISVKNISAFPTCAELLHRLKDFATKS